MRHTRLARIVLLAMTLGIAVWPATAHADCSSLPDDSGRVSGRVVDIRGIPVAGLPIDLVGASDHDVPGGSQKRVSGWTAANGTFELHRVEPGEYVLGINSTRNHDGRLLLPRAFYPGVVEAHQARTIAVGAGERVHLLDFVVPQNIELTTVTGVVVETDGKPASGATLTLRDNSEGPNIIGRGFRTQEDGRFTFSVVLNSRYDLHVAHRPATESAPPLVAIKYFTACVGFPPLTVILRPQGKH